MNSTKRSTVAYVLKARLTLAVVLFVAFVAVVSLVLGRHSVERLENANAIAGVAVKIYNRCVLVTSVYFFEFFWNQIEIINRFNIILYSQ